MITQYAVTTDPEERNTFVVVNAILKYFGIPSIEPADCPVKASESMAVLRSHGLRTTAEWHWRLNYAGKLPLLRYACEHFPEGVYFLFCSGHVMALIDGELVDTQDGSPRRSVHVVRVYR